MRRFLLLFVLLCYGTYLSARPDTRVATIKTDTIPCTDSVRLTMQTAGDGVYYLWSTGDTTQSIIVTQSGNYTCTVKDANQQVIDEAKVNVTVPEVPKVQMDFADYLSDTLRAYLLPDQEETWTWYKDGEVISKDPWALALKGSGLYTVALTDLNGCTYKANYNYVDTFNYSLAMNIQVSPCDSSVWLFQANVANLKPGDSVAERYFSFGDNTSSAFKDTWHTFAAPGTYKVFYYVITETRRFFSGDYTVVVPEKANSLSARIVQHYDTLKVTFDGRDSSFFKYKWTRDLVEISDTGQFIIPTAAGSYAVSAYTSFGCGAAANYEYRPLDISLYMYAQACDSTTWTISNETTYNPSGSPIVSNVIDYGDGTTGASATPHKYATPGVYNVTGTITTAEGRQVVASRPLVVPEFLPVSVSFYLKTGVQDTLFAKPDYRETSFYTYRWFKDGELVSGSDYYYIPATSGRYEVWLNSTYGCFEQFSINYTKPAAVSPTIGTNGNLQLVADFDTVTFNEDNVFNIELTVRNTDSRMLTSEEVISLGTIKGTDASNLSVSIPDSLACASNYTVRVVSSSPADTTLWSSTFSITNQPAQPVITQVGDSLFTSSIYDLQWYKDGVAISGATNAAIRARANGAYTVTALNGTGCTSTSAAKSVVITAITNVTLSGNTVSAFPNPSEGQVYLKFGYPLTEKVLVKVYNINGVVAYATTTVQQQTLLDLTGLPKGFYTVEVTLKGARKALSIILQ